MREKVSAPIGAALVAALAIGLLACGGDNEGAPATTTFQIGALLSLTGNWSTLGLTSRAALERGVADANAELERSGSVLRLELMVADTALDPDRALAELGRLAGEGIRIAVGPQSSAEVAAIKSYADQHGILVVSQSSTAHSLAIAGDNVFRLSPDDLREGAAVSALMWQDGRRVIVPLTRDDAGNQGLQAAVREEIESRGGTVLPLTSYAPDTAEFSTIAAALEAQVEQAVTQHGASAVAVYYTSFDEAVALFNAAAPSAVLGSVAWYGGDGVASSAALLGDPVAAKFASRTGFPTPIFGLDPAAADRWQPLSDDIRTATGIAPDAFALSTYDAVWLAMQARLDAGSNDIDALKSAFVAVAEDYVGVTGPARLNAAGDRESGPFDFFAICAAGDTAEWQHVGLFEPPDEVRFEGCGG
jgi:branched-chain amino acid transport system substrate-binding protein